MSISVLMGLFCLHPCLHPPGRRDRNACFIKTGTEKGIYAKFTSKIRTEIRPLEKQSSIRTSRSLFFSKWILQLLNLPAANWITISAINHIYKVLNLFGNLMVDFNIEGQDQIKIPTTLCGALYLRFCKEKLANCIWFLVLTCYLAY